MEAKEQILQAITNDDLNRFIRLIESEPCLLEDRYDSGITLVQLVAYHKKPEFMDYLLDKVSYLDIFEAAALGNTVELKRNLGEEGTLLDAYSTDGFTPLGLACFFGHTEAVTYLVGKGAGINKPSANDLRVSPLHSAAASGKLDIVQILAENGADLNASQAGGFTALHAAAHNGNGDMVRYLITSGADPDQKTDDGKTALDLAMEGGFRDIASYLWDINNEE